MNKPLELIISPDNLAEFRRHFQNNNFVKFDQPLKGIDELRKLPFFESLKSLFHSWPTFVTSYLPGIADEGNSEDVTVIQAKNLFEKGHGLCFNDVNNYLPILEECLSLIRNELGLSELTFARSLIYAIKKGQGTAAHFDQNINFVIQVSGTKKWWVATNEHVDNPLSRHTIGIEVDLELASYTKDSMPENFPENATEFTLQPGSILFVPRGSWHRTESISDAVSLNFTFTAPCWLDILTTAVRAHLVQSSQWRETANFLTDNSSELSGPKQFNFLFSQLAHDIQNWRAKDIMALTERGKSL